MSSNNINTNNENLAENLAERAFDKTLKAEGYFIYVTLFSGLLFFIFLSPIVLCFIPIAFILYLMYDIYYDKKYNYSAYIYKKNRENEGVKFCPYCGSNELIDENSETTCNICHKEIKC